MDQYFTRMEAVAQNPELAPRIRFMLRDVIELRADDWVPRKASSTEGPRPIHQVKKKSFKKNIQFINYCSQVKYSNDVKIKS